MNFQFKIKHHSLSNCHKRVQSYIANMKILRNYTIKLQLFIPNGSFGTIAAVLQSSCVPLEWQWRELEMNLDLVEKNY